MYARARKLGASTSYLEKHELFCLYSLLDVATTLKVFEFSERVLYYTHLVIFERQGTKQPVFDKDQRIFGVYSVYTPH